MGLDGEYWLDTLAGCEYFLFDEIDRERTFMNEHELHACALAHDQIKDLLAGNEQFADDYLENRAILLFYQRMVDYANTTNYLSCIDRLLPGFKELTTCYIELAADTDVEHELEEVFGQKWTCFKTLVNKRQEEGAYRWSDWRHVQRAIADKKHSQVNLTEDTSWKQKATRTLWSKDPRRSVIMLFLAAALFIISMVLYTLVRQYSSDVPGSVRDSDFWLLLQSSFVQSFTFVISGESLWRRSALPRWTWISPALFAVLMSIIGSILYIYLPPYWSACLTMVGGYMQALVSVVLTIYGI